MNENPAPSPPPGKPIYCPGCNERFRVVFAPGLCPRCGTKVEMGEIGAAETMLLKSSSAAGRGAEGTVVQQRDAAESLSGREIGIYHCEALLGSGGMGCVYLARHADLERKCALKVLSPRAVSGDVDYGRRFLDEARAAAALVHPNIVTVHAVGEADGHQFLEMEFVAGRSLQGLIEDRGRLSPARATTLAIRIAEGLAAAHREGFVHRDLKPDNVLVTHHGIPKLGDFGLAKRIHADDGLPARSLIGTPHFMAPELFRGRGASPASDVYALGVTYFLMLTGRLPFTAGSLSGLMTAAGTEPPPSPRDLAPDVSLETAECLSLLLAKSPENRPRDGIEAVQLLHAVAGKVRDIESLLAEAFRDTPGISWTRSGRRHRLNVTLPDGRRQTLYVEPSDHAPSERLIMIYSVCCPADPAYFPEALRLNARVSHGAVAIREVDGRDCFVMADTYPRGTVDIEEVRRSVLEVASRADAVEKLLTGRDHN